MKKDRLTKLGIILLILSSIFAFNSRIGVASFLDITTFVIILTGGLVLSIIFHYLKGKCLIFADVIIFAILYLVELYTIIASSKINVPVTIVISCCLIMISSYFSFIVNRLWRRNNLFNANLKVNYFLVGVITFIMSVILYLQFSKGFVFEYIKPLFLHVTYASVFQLFCTFLDVYRENLNAKGK